MDSQLGPHLSYDLQINLLQNSTDAGVYVNESFTAYHFCNYIKPRQTHSLTRLANW